MAQSKEEFLEQFGGDYGYPDAPRGIDELRAADFKRLEGMVYLDHAGATLYSEAQMADVAKDLMSNVYGNPHSQSDSSTATSDLVTSMRHQVLHIIKIPDLPVLVFVFSIICKLIYIQCKESTLKINRCCNSFVGKRTPMLVIGIHYLFYARHLTIFMSVSAYRLK